MLTKIHGTRLKILPIPDECRTYNQSECEAGCAGRELETVGELYPDTSCPLNYMGCRCCEPFNQNLCHQNCELEGKEDVNGAKNYKGCSVCQCVCPPFSTNDCKVECDAQGRIPIAGVTSPYECPLCQCTCSPLDQTFCRLQCRAQGREMLEGATNQYGCPDCQCIGTFLNI